MFVPGIGQGSGAHNTVTELGIDDDLGAPGVEAHDVARSGALLVGGWSASSQAGSRGSRAEPNRVCLLILGRVPAIGRLRRPRSVRRAGPYGRCPTSSDQGRRG
jgi:hypothetical protein